jgi:hypothetical protein
VIFFGTANASFVPIAVEFVFFIQITENLQRSYTRQSQPEGQSHGLSESQPDLS